MSEATRFGHYVLIRLQDGTEHELGHGPWGITYKAWDAESKHDVALTVISPTLLGTPQASDRFLQEAEAIAQLHHPNIAALLHVGESTSGERFYVTELCEGPTLDRAVKAEGPVPLRDALHVILQATQALTAAEERHLRHGDIKPTNLVLTAKPEEDTVVKLVNFGLARAFGEGHETIGALVSSGLAETAYFASPELLAENEDIDIRSDIYSVGACLWFMLTGHPPFEGPVALAMSRTLFEEVPWEKVASQPEPVIALLKSMLAKKPAARVASPALLSQEIQEYLRATEPPPPPPADPPPAAPLAQAELPLDGVKEEPLPPLNERFQPVEEIERDATGRLFRAIYHAKNGTSVRYRLIDRALTTVPATWRELQAQITAAHEYNHPNFVNVITAETTDDGLVIIQDYIQGFSISDLLKARGRLAPAEGLFFLKQLALAADYAGSHAVRGFTLAKKQVFIHFPGDIGQLTFPQIAAMPLKEWPPYELKADVISLGDWESIAPGGVPVTETKEIGALACLACDLLGGQGGRQFIACPRVSETGNSLLLSASTVAGAFPTAQAFVDALGEAVGRITPASERRITLPPPSSALVPDETNPPTAPTLPPASPQPEPALEPPPVSPELPMSSPEPEPTDEPVSAQAPPAPAYPPPPQSLQSAFPEPAPEPTAEPTLAEASLVPTSPPAPRIPRSAFPAPAPKAESPLPPPAQAQPPSSAKIEPLPPSENLRAPRRIPGRNVPKPRPFGLLEWLMVLGLLMFAVVDGIGGYYYYFIYRPHQESLQRQADESASQARLSTDQMLSAQQTAKAEAASEAPVQLPTPPAMPAPAPAAPTTTTPAEPAPSAPTESPQPAPMVTPPSLAPTAPPTPETTPSPTPSPTEAPASTPTANTAPTPEPSPVAPAVPSENPEVTGLRDKANDGNFVAARQLGLLYYSGGTGVAKDYTEALKWLQLAANHGDAEAQTRLGTMYFNGWGVDKNYAQALQWHQKAADQGNSEALNHLGAMYAAGWGVPQDLPRAFNLIKKAANQGDAEGEISLGDMYKRGLGVTKDYAQAMTWFKKAANQGNPSAYSEIGFLYAKGYGVKQDYSEAFIYFQKAADQGDAGGEVNIGDMLLNGWGLPKDYAQALAWYQKAADQGDPVGLTDLGDMYENGWGVPRDYAQAGKFYQRAADQGNAVAQNNLGFMYQNGWGMEQDYTQAMNWYQKAADQGNAAAQNNLGCMYASGLGVKQDYTQALDWLKKSAAQGDGQAMRLIGTFYTNGWGVAKDDRQALKWFQKAAAAGDSSAALEIQKLKTTSTQLTPEL